MSDSAVAGRDAFAGIVVFHARHVPPITNGTHELGAKHHLALDSSPEIAAESALLRIRITGPQTSLGADHVVSVFPADRSAVTAAAWLPHVTVSPGTLPWTRSPTADDHTHPWLAVLVLDDSELASATLQSTTAAELDDAIPHDDVASDTPVTVLHLPAALAHDLVPPLDDLGWFAHVRSMAGTTDRETATIVSSRLPAPGVGNHVFVVSLEGRYRGRRLDVGNADTVPLVVVHAWSFTCSADLPHGFVEEVTALGANGGAPPAFAVAGDQPVSPAVDSRLGSGFVPVRHHRRDGIASPGWYHGPLLPGPPPYSAEIGSWLPVQHSDDLLVVDPAVGVFDVSYAAARQLGQLIMLQHRDVAIELRQWKRALAHTIGRSGDTFDGPVLRRVAGLDVNEPDLPASVARFIDRELFSLASVPFRYLVPDERLLPVPSLRFVDVDPGWLDCLLDGAASVGSVDTRTRDLADEVRSRLPEAPLMSGILIRSPVVTDYPDLEITGYATIPVDDDQPDALAIRRLEHLSPSVILALFDGRVRAVDVHLHPQAIHFGFDEVLTAPTRARKTVEGRGDLDIGEDVFTPQRRIHPRVLGDLVVDAAVSDLDERVAHFARLMVEGVPLVRFAREVPT